VSPSGAGEAPLIAGKIHGVRGWTVQGDRLHAAYTGTRWRADGSATSARCRDSRHPAPTADCGCGLYALHPWAMECHGDVLGVVEAWGRVEVHADGFRAEHARPVALFASAGWIGLPGRLELAAAHECELIEVESFERIAAVCEERGWGLSREVVADLVPAEVPPVYEPPPPHVPAPPAPRAPDLVERIESGVVLLFAGLLSLAYAAFWGVMGLGILAAITGWHPFGWAGDEEPEPELVRAPQVRIAEDAIIPPDGRGPPVYVAVLKNRGRDAAVWARPSLVYASDAERVNVGREDFGYPAVVPAGSRALVVQPLNGADPKTVEVRPGPISARDVDRGPRAPARVRAELVPAGGRDCRLVAAVNSKARLDRLRIWMLAAASGKQPAVLLQRSAGAVPAGRSRQLLDRFHDCPAELPEVRAFPAFGAGQLID